MTASQIILYILLAIAATALSEAFLGRRARGGVLTTILLASLGAWLSVQLLRITITGEPVVEGIPLLTAALGAFAVAFIWSILAYPRNQRYR